MPPAVINDVLGGEAVVVFLDGADESGAVFSPTVNGEALTFEVRNDEVVDTSTSSIWNPGGRAVSGPLAGTQLRGLPSKTSFWFSAVASEPTVTVYGSP